MLQILTDPFILSDYSYCPDCGQLELCFKSRRTPSPFQTWMFWVVVAFMAMLQIPTDSLTLSDGLYFLGFKVKNDEFQIPTDSFTLSDQIFMVRKEKTPSGFKSRRTPSPFQTLRKR